REDMQKGFARYDERFERMETKLTALGSRWGIDSEATFRNAMRGLLEEDFHVKVQNLILIDDEAFVFGAKGVPIEYDVVVTDGGATLIEIKSSVGRDDVYVFLRKIEFFKKRMGMEVRRGIIASPFFERDSAEIAKKNGLEVYTGSKPSEQEGEGRNE
ncbi:MAG: endonuclease NucS, partial [TACK group archaeon]|nr:endonuclease NucS [TACK group archaeon]